MPFWENYLELNSKRSLDRKKFVLRELFMPLFSFSAVSQDMNLDIARYACGSCLENLLT